MEECGIVESVKKANGPRTKMTLLGVQFDSVRLILSVTEERKKDTLVLLDAWLNKSHATKKEVQSLVGKLSFIAACVRPGRIFLSRIFAFLRTFKVKGSKRLSCSIRKDIKWWKEFLPLYNCVSMMQVEEWSKPDQVFASDSCLVGCGAYLPSKRLFYHVDFPKFVKDQFDSEHHITQLETLAIVLACRIWGEFFRGQRILIQCDNEGSVEVINTGRAHNAFLQDCLREIAFYASIWEFEIKTKHIAGVKNRIPDALSRWSLGNQYKKEFFRLVGDEPVYECKISDELFHFQHTW